MKAFHTGREAKEFLISKIVEEAQRGNVPLSEVEHKMLYFTKSGWTLPDIMKVSEDFDREYDQAQYEKKIAKLVTKADRRIRKGSRDDYEKWWAAIRFLRREDHYITVMIRLAGLRPRGDQLRLFVTGLGIVACIFVWTFLGIKYDIPMPSRGNLGVSVWAALCLLLVAYVLLRFILGRKRVDDLMSKVLEKMVIRVDACLSLKVKCHSPDDLPSLSCTPFPPGTLLLLLSSAAVAERSPAQRSAAEAAPHHSRDPLKQGALS